MVLYQNRLNRNSNASAMLSSISKAVAATRRRICQRSYMSWPMLSEEQVQIAQMCRNYAETELAPSAAALDREHRFPEKEIQGLAKLGMMGVAVSADYGGSG